MFQKFKNEYFPIRILDKYLFSMFFSTFLGTMILLIGLFIFIQVNTDQKNFIASKESNINIYLYLLFKIPKIISIAFPISMMFSVCFIVGQFSSNKELVASMAAGVSFYRTVSPIIFFGIASWITLFFFNEFVVRPANKHAAIRYTRIMNGIGNKTDMVYQLHIKGKEGFYYVYWLDQPNKTVKGGFSYIKINEENFPEYIVSAQNAKYNPTEKNWKLEKIEEISFDEKLKVKSHKNFPEKIYEFPESSDYFLKPVKKPEEMNFFELGEEMQIRKQKGRSAYDLQIERHVLFAEPILCLIAVLIGCIAGGKTTRQAGVLSLGVSIVVLLVYFVFYFSLKAIGENGAIPSFIAVWTTPLSFLSIAIFMFKNMKL